jgi:hypothetical protein
MAGIFQGDIIIKTAIELALMDFTRNPWLVEHMLWDLKNIVYLQQKYGQPQIDACKAWLANNQVDVYMGPSNEKPEMKTMADLSVNTLMLYPQQINKTIPYVISPFSGYTYDDDSGLLTVPSNIDLTAVVPKQLVVDPSTGNGYVIQSISPDGLILDTGLTINAATLGILPQFRYWVARLEHSFFAETYKIGCHAHGDPQVMLWLWSITKYAILRYRESMLEANGFCESCISSDPPTTDTAWSTSGGETAWSRYLTLSGQIENSWIKSPKRIVESFVAKDPSPTNVTPDPTGAPPSGIPIPAYVGGIKIISNTQPISAVEAQLLSWYPINQANE